MGCFMGCFGLSSTKKRRNSTRKILPRDQRICSYEPLHSIDDTSNISSSTLRCEVEEKEEEKKRREAKKTRKKVRFNLDVQIYEPILQPTFQNDCCSDDGEERNKGSSVFEKAKTEDRSLFTSDYRYHNCVDSFEDEDDEMAYGGESDLEEEDEEYYTDDKNDYEDDADDEDEEEDEDLAPLLNPVVNLAQWKAVKARPVKVKKLMKENVVKADTTDDQSKPLLKEIVVNTSLSNWIATSKRSPIVDITNRFSQ